MTDYGHDLLFGTVLTPDAASPGTVLELARLSERLDLDLVSVADHPYRPKFLDAMVLLTSIAAHTSRIHVLPNVANLPLRAPAGLARAFASLDILSGGRAELGIGGGGYMDAITGEGGPRRSPGEAVDALGEAIHLIRALWTPGPPVSYIGDHYRIREARPGPPTQHDIVIWVGAVKPKMLKLIGGLADGWLPSANRVPPAQLAYGQQIIDEAATAAARDPRRIRRLYNIPGDFDTGRGFCKGPPQRWAEQLAELTLTVGVSGYLFSSDDPEMIRRFAHDVVPDVQQRVAQERNR